MERARHPAYRLGDAVVVEPSLHRVVVGGTTRRVTPKAIQVLELLLERPGELVRREELLDGVWPETAIGEDVLTRAVADLRKALDDSPGAPWAIETVPKAGYRLIASVRPSWPPSPPPAAAAEASPPPVRRLGRTVAKTLGVAVAATVVVVFAAAVVATLRAVRSGREAPPRVFPLTTLPGLETGPALSPDGSRIAFAASEGSGEAMTADWDVWVAVVGQESRLRLTAGPAVDVSPAWSPGGDAVAFLRREGDACTVVVVPALGGPERRLGSCGRNVAADLAWSPDGRWLAFSDRESEAEPFRIVLLAADGGERRALPAAAVQHWGDRDPAFAPDSRSLVFLRSVSMLTQDLYRVGLDGEGLERLTTDGRFLGGHAFAADGSLVFVSARSGVSDLWRLPAGGGEPEWLGAAVMRPRNPTLQGSRVVVESWRFDADLFRLDLADGGAPRPVARSTREDIFPALSPDGARTAFVSTRSGAFELWLDEPAGARALTAFGGPFVGAPSFSPDGHSIAFDARPEGHADVYVVAVDGGRPRRLTFEPSNDLEPSWSADGRSLFFGSDRSGRWQVWRVGVDGGEAVPVSDDGAYAPQPAPDGATLFTSRFDAPGLFRRPLGDGRLGAGVVVPGTESCGGFARCAPTARGLVAVRETADGWRLAILDPASGERLGERPFAGRVEAGLAATADGSTLVYSQVVEQTSDLVAVDLER